MTKYAFCILFLIFISSCKEAQTEVEETIEEPNSFSIQDYPKLIELALNEAVEQAVKRRAAIKV